MSMYDFRCKVCGDVITGIEPSDSPVRICGKCGGEMQRLIGQASVKFTGGFKPTSKLYLSDNERYDKDEGWCDI